ncbi:MAG: hypothetical protein U0176_05465 [Bacteroidia bacterium]
MVQTMIRMMGCVGLAMLLFCTNALAQTVEDAAALRWEAGIEAIRLDLGYKWWGQARYMNLVQPMSGIYVRRYFDRLGFRVGTQFAKHFDAGPRGVCYDCGQVETHGYSLGMYSGVSYQLTKRVGWLHAIGDLSWQMYRGKGEYQNYAWGWTHQFIDYRTQEVMLRIGLNLRVPVTKHLFIGSEMLLCNGVRAVRDQREDLVEGGTSIHRFVFAPIFEPLTNLMLGVKL